jgi:putative DNA primase/helicase
MGDRLDVRTAAAGRWRSILTTLGMDERSLSGKHGPARCVAAGPLPLR